MARPRARVVTRTVRRLTEWVNVLPVSAGVALTGTQTLGNLGTALGVSTGLKGTIVRIRGEALVHFDPTSAQDVFFVAMGLGMFSSDGFAAGPASVPSPLDDPDWGGWIWHKLFAFGPAVSATEDDASLAQTVRQEIDSKAMRKWSPNETLGFSVDGQIFNGGGTYDYSAICRVLFLNP